MASVQLKSIIVTADQHLAWVLHPKLGKLQYEVETCRDIAEAAEKLRRVRYHVVIVDGAVAGTKEAVHLLRGMPLHRRTTVVAIINGDFASAKDFMEAGADFVWRRPLHPQPVMAALVAARTNATGDKRARRRVPLQRLAYVRYSFDGVHPHQGVIVDINESGLAMEALDGLEAGRTVHISINLPAMNSPIDAMAEIVWRNHRGRVGLRFLEMSEAAVRRLERWLGVADGGMGEFAVLIPHSKRALA